jgi:hypothetical protein
MTRDGAVSGEALSSFAGGVRIVPYHLCAYVGKDSSSN